MQVERRWQWWFRFSIGVGFALIFAGVFTMGVAMAEISHQDLLPEKPTSDRSMLPHLAGVTAPEPGPPVTTWYLIIGVIVIIAVVVYLVISRRNQE